MIPKSVAGVRWAAKAAAERKRGYEEEFEPCDVLSVGVVGVNSLDSRWTRGGQEKLGRAEDCCGYDGQK